MGEVSVRFLHDGLQVQTSVTHSEKEQHTKAPFHHSDGHEVGPVAPYGGRKVVWSLERKKLMGGWVMSGCVSVNGPSGSLRRLANKLWHRDIL